MEGREVWGQNSKTTGLGELWFHAIAPSVDTWPRRHDMSIMALCYTNRACLAM